MSEHAMMTKMKIMAAKADGVKFTADSPSSVSGDSFKNVMDAAMSKVVALEKDSGEKMEAFQLGKEGVSLAEVKIASEKSGLAFEALRQVRNQLIRAYQTVSRMPI